MKTYPKLTSIQIKKTLPEKTQQCFFMELKITALYSMLII